MSNCVIVTPPCFKCGESSEVEVPASAFTRYQAGALVQQAFPDMTADQREVIVSGTHPACWTAMFGEED